MMTKASRDILIKGNADNLQVVDHDTIEKYRELEDKYEFNLESMLSNAPQIDLSRSKRFLELSPITNRMYEKYLHKKKEKAKQRRIEEQVARMQLKQAQKDKDDGLEL